MMIKLFVVVIVVVVVVFVAAADTVNVLAVFVVLAAVN